jgi:asparagine synthase (glutamine-hydrolysing)
VCGIAGVVAPVTAERSESVRRMTATLTHRGPDDDGFFEDESVALGMRRLSIIDLPGGHQPIRSEDGVVIVYNGEAYNYRSLREDLRREGVTFATESDTEVVLQLYRTHGIEAISQVQGMFGLCIYDPRRNELHLVRDRLGVKPLYYRHDRDGLTFASEIKAILAGRGHRPKLDRQAIHDYLTLRFVPPPGTIWEGIHKLEPGHRLRLDLETGKAEVSRWWDVEFDSQPLDAARDYEGEFEELLLAAVEKRLLAADVPVGVMLSGGLDSSAVSAAAVELGHRDFHTFSVGFADGGTTSELGHARSVAEHIGSRHHEVTVDRDGFLEFLPRFVEATDEPLADLASVPLHYVSELAREDVKVVLSGEGADEVLAGYDLERLAADLDRWRRIARLPRPALKAAARLAPAGRAEWLPTLADAGWSELLRADRVHITDGFDEGEKAALWRDRDGLRPTGELLGEWYSRSQAEHPIDQLQQVYCRGWLVEDLLMKADKMTMHNSLELRVPFLDHELVEWAARAPLELKVGGPEDGWSSKRALRDFARKRLPAAIIERPKQGFPVPAYDWLAGPLADWMRDRLAPGGPLDELFEVKGLEAVVDGASGGDATAAHKAWNALILGEWLERWRS